MDTIRCNLKNMKPLPVYINREFEQHGFCDWILILSLFYNYKYRNIKLKQAEFTRNSTLVNMNISYISNLGRTQKTWASNVICGKIICT